MSGEKLSVSVAGMWCQGKRNLAIRLVAADGAALPAWQPGAHIDIHLPGEMIRQYSLTGDYRRREAYLICVAREQASRGGSRYIYDSLRPGQRLSVSAPRNLFVLESARRVTLMAAGIGITPLYAMALKLAAEGTPFRLCYYLKERLNGAFLREIQENLPQGSWSVSCSEEGASPRRLLATDLGQAREGEHLYLCGPSGFMAAGRQAAQDNGWQAEQIHSEAFQPLPAVTAAGGDTFTVTLRSSGEQWPVPGDRTIAQVLQEQNIAIPLSCEMGICGACLTPVLEGQADHRDSVQSDAEKSAARQYIALCCSRSHSANLLLDL